MSVLLMILGILAVIGGVGVLVYIGSMNVLEQLAFALETGMTIDNIRTYAIVAAIIGVVFIVISVAIKKKK